MRGRFLLPALILAASAGGLAVAQVAPADQAAATLAEKEAREAQQRSRQMEEAATAAESEAERLRAQAEALVAAIEASEARISAAEARVRILNERRAEQQARLAERQQPLIRLSAALQMMARRPPALALVQPGSVQEAARARALLASALPVIRQRTEALRNEMAHSNALAAEARKAIVQVVSERNELARRRTAFARLEAGQRERSEELARNALWEADRSIALTEEARDISGRMSSRAFQAAIAQDLAALPPPIARPEPQARPARPAPYRMPTQGKVLTGFGEIMDAGIHSRGILLKPEANAAILVPRSGMVAYAGRFRSYGEVVILDHGGGWTSTITNLGALQVARGDQVKIGDRLGRANGDEPVGIELRYNGSPQPIASFIMPR